MPASTHYTVAITIPEQSDLRAPPSLPPPARQPVRASRAWRGAARTSPCLPGFLLCLFPSDLEAPARPPPRTRRRHEPSCALFAPAQRSRLALAAPPRLALLPPLSAL